jgi:hypothetical protein
MSALDVQALETNFENWRKERVPHLSIGEAFERYAIERPCQDNRMAGEGGASRLTG